MKNHNNSRDSLHHIHQRQSLAGAFGKEMRSKALESSYPENIGERIKNTRRKYLEALGICLEANPESVKAYVSYLLDDPHHPMLDYNKDRPEHHPEVIEIIEEIGSHFTGKSGKQSDLRLTVGSRVLALLKEDIDSQCYSSLSGWIRIWTDGAKNEEFDELIR